MKIVAFIFVYLLLLLGYSAFSQTDSLRAVVAKQGDGIYKLLRDNGYEAKDYYHKFLNLNKDKIQLEDQLILGETYYLPKIEKKESETSENHQNNKSQSNAAKAKLKLRIAESSKGTDLSGAVFYIIAGHGGPDPGATSYVNGTLISEDEYAYDIALRFARAIEEQSGKVYMIIDDPDDGIREDKILKIDYDEYLYPDYGISRDKNERLIERSDVVNKLFYENKSAKYQRLIEIHLESRPENQSVDAFFYYCQGSEFGKQLAENMQNVFKEKYAKYQPNRGYSGSVSMRNLLVIRRAIPPAVLIEIGNIQNEKDRLRLFNPDNREALAKWMSEALIFDYNRNK